MLILWEAAKKHLYLFEQTENIKNAMIHLETGQIQ